LPTPAHRAHALWPAFETIHATVYFAPEAPEAYQALGLKGGWMAYFATRAAAMGAASPGLVTAVFYNFHPAMVARALPDAWALTTPEEVLAARLQVVDAALRRLLPEHIDTPGLAEAAALAREAAEAPALSGRPLYGALRSLPWPEDAHLALWHAATLLREHRGDGHVAALTAAGLDGCEAHVALVATGRVTRATLQDNRKWSDEEWAAAEARLRGRGWLDAAAQFTKDGRARHQQVEDTTDALAAAPWEHLGPERTARLLELLGPLAHTIAERGGVPVPNPVGVPAP
jgi:helix-turn-helix protein